MKNYPINDIEDENYRPEILIHPERLEKLETELADKEKQLAEARAEIERLKYNLACADQAAENQEAEKEFDLESMRRLIACKDKLIEQMCEALKTVVSSAPPSGPLWHGSAEIEKAVAAIKAAERGE